MKKDAQNIRSAVADNKQKLSYETELNGVTYQVTVTLNAGGNGAKDIKKKLISLLENELRRQLKNN